MRTSSTVLLLASLVASCAASPRPTNPRAPQMRAHFEDAERLRELIRRGDLVAMRSVAATFRERVEDAEYVEGSAPSIEVLVEGLARSEAASSPAEAASALASIGAACGACHRSNKVDVPAVSSGPRATGRMDALARAEADLWFGLIAPSEASWASGAKAFHRGISCSDIPKTPRSPHDDGACSAVRATASAVLTANDAQARRLAYADLLATCSGCHAARRRSSLEPPLRPRSAPRSQAP